MKEKTKRPARLLFLVSGLLLGATFSLLSPAGGAENPTLAILPLLVEKGEEPDRAAICPFCKGAYRKGEIQAGAAVVLRRLLHPKMEALNLFSVTPAEKADEILTPRRRQEMEEKPLASSIRIGKEMNVDFVLVGFVYHFEERVGSSLGVEKPASAGFDLHLLRLRDGKAVWDGRFHETQQPLSENLLRIGAFLRRKASWLTVEDLAGVGVDEMLGRFPTLKELQE
jgi:hypothetical protein